MCFIKFIALSFEFYKIHSDLSLLVSKMSMVIFEFYKMYFICCESLAYAHIYLFIKGYRSYPLGCTPNPRKFRPNGTKQKIHSENSNKRIPPHPLEKSVNLAITSQKIYKSAKNSCHEALFCSSQNELLCAIISLTSSLKFILISLL